MRFAFIILVFLLTSTVSAEESSLDFKGIALGSDIASIEGSSRFSCRDPQNPIADRICSLNFGERETIAGAPVQALMLFYYSGKLETISISFDSKHFSEVAAALTEKYGTGSVKTQTIQNRMGATFENKIHSWRRGIATVETKRYSHKIDRSSVTYYTDFSLKEFARRQGTAVKEKADDL